jgi:hypothetical protein
MALDTLNADEQKYFDSKGATAPSPAPAAQDPSAVPAADPAASRAPATDAKAAEAKTVPLAALHEERERRKELQRQIEDVNRRADERFNLIAQKLAASTPAPGGGAEGKREMPDPEKDAVGAIRMTAEEVKVLSDFKRQVETQAVQSQAIQAVFAHAARLESEFEARAPDFKSASAFLRDARAQELSALGVDPYRVQQVLGLEKLQLAQAALQQGRNPAEVIYALAKMRGYGPKTGAGRAGAEEGEAAKLARIARGQEAGASLGAASGAAPGKTGIEALLAMSDGEFATALDKMSADQLRQHFGN